MTVTAIARTHAATTNTARHAAHRANVIAEVEHLTGYDTPNRIAARLGYRNPTSLARKLTEWRRPDLAAPFYADRIRDRKAG